MAFLYKLADEKEIEDAKEGKLSLTQPIFEFKGSEGKFINFAHRIYDKYKKRGLNIEPTGDDLKEISDWISVYKKTYGPDFNDIDIISESMIIFCGIMQGFCGYFTTKKLENKKILEKFLKLNDSKLKNKTGVIRIDTEIFKSHHWRTDDLNEPFEPIQDIPDDIQGFNGFTHLKKIKYIKKFNDYNTLLKIYNGDEIRHASNWFNNLSSKFKWQKEERIVFLLNSLEKNSSRIGCNRVYERKSSFNSWAEIVYCNLIDAIDYESKAPRIIYLKVDDSYVKCFSIEEIKKS